MIFHSSVFALVVLSSTFLKAVTCYEDNEPLLRLRGGGGGGGSKNTEEEDHQDNDPRQLAPIGSNFFEDYNLVGDASGVVIGGRECIQLTPDELWKAGGVWSKRKVDTRRPFTMEVDFFVGIETETKRGAGGMAFVIQAHNNTCPVTVGNGNLGYKLIPDALGVEIDTYANSYGRRDRHRNDYRQENLLEFYDYVALARTSPQYGRIQAKNINLSSTELYNTTYGEIEDGREHTLKVQWDQTYLSVSIDDKKYFDATLPRGNIISKFLNGNRDAFFGFTATTGADSNQHYISDVRVTGHRLTVN